MALRMVAPSGRTNVPFVFTRQRASHYHWAEGRGLDRLDKFHQTGTTRQENPGHIARVSKGLG